MCTPMRSIMARYRLHIGVSLRYTTRRPVLMCRRRLADQQRRQVFVQVPVAVGKPGAVDQHHVVEQPAVAFLGSTSACPPSRAIWVA